MILINDVKEHNINMIMEEEMPTNLTKNKTRLLIESDVSNNAETSDNQEKHNTENNPREFLEPKSFSQVKNETKIQLNFSVERLLGAEQQCYNQQTEQSCDNFQKYNFTNSRPMSAILPYAFYKNSTNTEDKTLPSTSTAPALVKPTPIRAIGNSSDTSVTISSPFANPISLMRYHGMQQAKQKSTQLAQTLQSLMTMPLHHVPAGDNSLLSSAQLYAMNSYQLQNSSNYHLRNSNTAEKQSSTFFYNNNNNSNTNNNYGNLISPTTTATSVATTPNNSLQQQQQQQQHNKQAIRNVSSGRNNNDFLVGSTTASGNKRKRSWSRAVFSNLQRKGLEIQFQQQKYITKPDRRKLAARLNLTDAQVKVWFQNRRMKWRHTRENLKSGQEKLVGNSTAQSSSVSSAIFKNLKQKPGEVTLSPEKKQDYSSDGDSSIDGSEREDIDVVE